MPATHILIQSVTVGAAGAATIDFTSIPQIYTDLKIVVSGRATTDNPTLQVFINNDQTAANYGFRLLEGTGAAVQQASAIQAWLARIAPSSASAGAFCNSELYFANYRSALNKAMFANSVTENNAASAAYSTLTAGLYTSASAITRIVLDPYGTDFAQFSTASLYGISNS